ncbi:hypothetical protein EAH89_30190 [Roseomonas nepalensis]|uniref:Uncharacterized protein n=1 Tax=Muricoccus nepalensis TaxID=1854500 RepID=A0A502EFA6_9PROT|nr:hypothetical protein [Roseomonas nepalensis]TPG36405.1 hypothetical protein EAH89_30190 [Roseomonas nepalensis]
MHLERLDDPTARRAALEEACGCLSEHLTAPLPPLPSSRGEPALIAAALHAARQLRGQLADA